ncbi:Intracellular exo-alpha-L-arabinofuranosidase 2 [compost metagenome]
MIHISACNLHHAVSTSVSCHIEGIEGKEVSGQILTHASLNAHNTFDRPEEVAPVKFTEVSLKDGELNFVLPPASVVVLKLV